MSVDLIAFVPSLSESLIPKLKQRFADIGMDVEFHPDFAFDAENDSGFLPTRWKVGADDSIKTYRGMDLSSGFEIYIDEYDYNKELSEVKSNAKPGFLARLFRKKETTPQQTYIADERTDKILQQCKKKVSIVINGHATSAFKIGNCFAAFLAELTNGIYWDPQSDEYTEGRDTQWIGNQTVLNMEYDEAEEISLTGGNENLSPILIVLANCPQ